MVIHDIQNDCHQWFSHSFRAHGDEQMMTDNEHSIVTVRK